jgi:hypothetical protein
MEIFMKTTLLGVAATCIAVAAGAQTFNTGALPNPQGAQPNGAASVPSHNIDQLATLLGLDEGQKAKVQTVLVEEHANAEALVRDAKTSGGNPSMEQLRAIGQQIEGETVEKLASVLTNAQLARFQQLQQAHGTQMLSPSSPKMARPANPRCDSSGKCTSR